MSRIVKYRPDYSMIYPNEVISDELLSFLKKSDARMEYEDVHRKRERIRKGKDGKEIVLPCLEHSVEVLIEAGHQFAASTPSPEQMLIEAFTIEELRRSIDRLDKDQVAIIHALFWDRLTIREFALKQGISKSSASRLKQRSLSTLRFLLKDLRN